MRSFARACADRAAQPRDSFALRQLEIQPDILPPVRLEHLRAMSDSTGMFQHAIFNVPNFVEGYTTDDNARAYILTTLLEELGAHDPHTPDAGSLGSTYLAFLWNAFNEEKCRFRNFMSFERQWLEAVGSEDSHGRALWAVRFTSPRAWAFTILAIHEYLRRFSGDRTANHVRETLADKLLDIYERCHGEGWEWFEDSLTYDNAILPHALILSGHWTSRGDVLEAGLRSLRWLLEIQTSPNGCFSPIGSNGFYRRGEERARFDQQPLEAASTVAACLEAFRITKDAFWQEKARTVYEWFLGRNDLGTPLYDTRTGGCRDGLHANRLNQNQGAESTLAALLALTEMRLARFAVQAADDRTRNVRVA